MILTIEGPDFSGKSTAIKKICNSEFALQFSNVKIVKLPFPDGTETNSHLTQQEIEFCKLPFKWNELSIIPFIMSANLVGLETASRLEKENNLVILDRGMLSTMVYQGSIFVKSLSNLISSNEDDLRMIFAKWCTLIQHSFGGTHAQIILYPSLKEIKYRKSLIRTDSGDEVLANHFEKNLEMYYNQYSNWLEYGMRICPTTVITDNNGNGLLNSLKMLYKEK